MEPPPQRRPAEADLVIPAQVQRQSSMRASGLLGIGALFVIAVVGTVALLGPRTELENRSKQTHFHQVFDRLEKKPSSGDVAQAARARKHAIAKMSTDRARSVLIKWGFLPPAQAEGSKQALHEVVRSVRRAGNTDGNTKGASSKEMARLRVEAGDDDLRPRHHDRTDEKDMNEDSHAIEHDREVVNSHLSRAERARARERVVHSAPTRETMDRREDEHHESAPRKSRGSKGFGHLEDVAVNLARAVQADQQGIVQQHEKLAADRNRLLQTRELIDKALSHLAEKSSRREPAREEPESRDPRERQADGADFSIKVRRNVQQQHERPSEAEERRSNYWKIPIRPRAASARNNALNEAATWAHVRRRRAPDARAPGALRSVSPLDPLSLEEAASADGLENVPASMAKSLIGQQAPSLATTADNYMHNVFGAVGGDTSDSVSSSHLRSAQPVAVQQYDKVQRMVDAMKGGGTGSMVTTYGANYAAGTAGQPYAAETPANTRFGESPAQVRRDGSYLTDVFERK